VLDNKSKSKDQVKEMERTKRSKSKPIDFYTRKQIYGSKERSETPK
jgi:hypothetical protein